MAEGGGQTERDPSGWTTDTLKAHFEAIMEEHKEFLAEWRSRLDERFDAQKDAINKAESRLDDTLRGFPEEYARRAELEGLKENLSSTATTLQEKVSDAARALETATDKSTEQVLERVRSLENLYATREGQTEGARITKAALYTALAGLATLIGIVVVLANYLSN